MNLIKTVYNTILDALFPLSGAEKDLFSYSPEDALKILPAAPIFNKLTVSLPETRAIFAYKDERVAKLIWNIKYKKSAQAVHIGGYALFSELTGKYSGETSIILIPIPITPKRRRERGFNQCELLVDEIARLTENPDFSINSGADQNQIIVEKNLLIRVQHSSRQTLKGRGERLEGAKGIFDVNEDVAKRVNSTGAPESQSKSTIVIIDDVITTGSTMKEAIDTLKRAGFENISGLSLAH